MKEWHRHLRGTVRIALTWAVLGALAGALVELLNDTLPGGLPLGSLFDVWPPVLAIAAFSAARSPPQRSALRGGVGFSESALPRFGIWRRWHSRTQRPPA